MMEFSVMMEVVMIEGQWDSGAFNDGGSNVFCYGFWLVHGITFHVFLIIVSYTF